MNGEVPVEAACHEQPPMLGGQPTRAKPRASVVARIKAQKLHAVGGRGTLSRYGRVTSLAAGQRWATCGCKVQAERATRQAEAQRLKLHHYRRVQKRAVRKATPSPPEARQSPRFGSTTSGPRSTNHASPSRAGCHNPARRRVAPRRALPAWPRQCRASSSHKPTPASAHPCQPTTKLFPLLCPVQHQWRSRWATSKQA